MTTLLDRLIWTIKTHQWNWRQPLKRTTPEELIAAIIREIESTHKIVDPEDITEDMLEACFTALPEHYDPPDMTRRPWHALKAKRRYTAMVRAVKNILK